MKTQARTRKQSAAITGLLWHRDDYCSFYIPYDWHKLPWPDGREGVIYGPDLADPKTVFAVEVKKLATAVATDDLDILAESYFETIQQLPEVDIHFTDQRSIGDLLELEAKYTFREQGAIRKRWTRMFYHGKRQIVMISQGASLDKYAYWLPLFFEAMMTANIHGTKSRAVSGV